MYKVKKLLCYRIYINKKFLQILSLYAFLNFKYLSKYFAQIYRAQYGAAMLVYLRRTPWRAENSVNIWNLLWLSKPLIVSTDQANKLNKHFSLYFNI